ncbi:MAG: hypothetical protein WA159_09295 [Variovorax sp.]
MNETVTEGAPQEKSKGPNQGSTLGLTRKFKPASVHHGCANSKRLLNY